MEKIIHALCIFLNQAKDSQILDSKTISLKQQAFEYNYIQGMNYVTGLVCHSLNDEQSSFWCLVQLFVANKNDEKRSLSALFDISDGSMYKILVY
jgi:hypothetical protein